MSEKGRTMAFQVPEEFFQRIKAYLTAHPGLTQKEFIIGLVEDALTQWEQGQNALERMEEKMYIYPDDLKAAPTLWLWRLRDLTAGGLMAVFGIVTLTQFRTPLFAAIAALYLFLTVRIEDACILDFVQKAGVYFIGRPRLGLPFYGGDRKRRSQREEGEKAPAP